METIKKLTTKEIVAAFVFITSLSGTWYKMQNDVDNLLRANQELEKKMELYEARLIVYSGLPNQVKEVESTVQENAKMLNVIHDGLVAKGIIPPRRN